MTNNNKTLNDFIADIRAETPTLTRGVNDDVIALSDDEYETTVLEWATERLKQQEIKLQEGQTEAAKAAAQAKLAALGLTADDLKALGL
jgi:exonuclease VII large subunit